MRRGALRELLTTVRGHYVDFWRAAIREERSRVLEGTVAVGVQLAIGDGTNPHRSRFNLPFRVDLIMGTAKAPELLTVVHEQRVGFDPIAQDFPEGFCVAIEPFSWESCDVLARGGLEDWRLPLAWFERWFDREDQKPEDADGLAPVIHEMTEPKETQLGLSFTVDFGAAPIEAFLELMVTLHESGLTDLRVGTFFP